MADLDSRAGGRYAAADIVAFLDDLHAAPDPALRHAFEAPERDGLPAIQVSPSEAKLLGMLIRLRGAKRVVEIGTLAGFSAIRIARALPEDGHLWTVEFDPKHAAVARRNLAAAGLADRVTVIESSGVDALDPLAGHGPFCAVFLDADKLGYATYAAWAARHVRPGGLLLADNAYYFGKLLETGNPAAASVKRMHEEARAAFDTVCIPTPDGMLFGIRK